MIPMVVLIVVGVVAAIICYRIDLSLDLIDSPYGMSVSQAIELAIVTGVLVFYAGILANSVMNGDITDCVKVWIVASVIIVVAMSICVGLLIPVIIDLWN